MYDKMSTKKEQYMFNNRTKLRKTVFLKKFIGNSVIVHAKGDKEREVYFNIRCSIWLKRYLEKRDDKEDCLFVQNVISKDV